MPIRQNALKPKAKDEKFANQQVPKMMPEEPIQKKEPEANLTKQKCQPKVSGKNGASKVVEEGGETMYYDHRPGFSEKKRVLFFLIGLFLGFLGLHFLYIRRTFLFLFTAFSFVALIACAIKGLNLIFFVSALTMFCLWIGGTLFIKRDDDGLPMKWFGYSIAKCAQCSNVLKK